MLSIAKSIATLFYAIWSFFTTPLSRCRRKPQISLQFPCIPFPEHSFPVLPLHYVELQGDDRVCINRTWHEDKKRFVRPATPLPASDNEESGCAGIGTLKRHEIAKLQKGYNQVPKAPAICIDNWGDANFRMSDLFGPTSAVAPPTEAGRLLTPVPNHQPHPIPENCIFESTSPHRDMRTPSARRLIRHDPFAFAHSALKIRLTPHEHQTPSTLESCSFEQLNSMNGEPSLGHSSADFASFSGIALDTSVEISVDSIPMPKVAGLDVAKVRFTLADKENSQGATARVQRKVASTSKPETVLLPRNEEHHDERAFTRTPSLLNAQQMQAFSLQDPSDNLPSPTDFQWHAAMTVISDIAALPLEAVPLPEICDFGPAGASAESEHPFNFNNSEAASDDSTILSYVDVFELDMCCRHQSSAALVGDISTSYFVSTPQMDLTQSPVLEFDTPIFSLPVSVSSPSMIQNPTTRNLMSSNAKKAKAREPSSIIVFEPDAALPEEVSLRQSNFWESFALSKVLGNEDDKKSAEYSSAAADESMESTAALEERLQSLTSPQLPNEPFLKVLDVA